MNKLLQIIHDSKGNIIFKRTARNKSKMRVNDTGKNVHVRLINL